MKRAIVLSGGGSRGAYQIGVWHALRKLRIKYDIVTGTSVGALNGVLMTQNSFRKAYKLWSNMDFNVVFDNVLNKNRKDIYKMYLKNITLEGGMDAVNLYKAIDKLVDEKKVRNSKINFGLVTAKYPSLKNVSLTKLEIPKGKLNDYLIASSACFPAFKKKKIDDSYYIDGGYYDNLPINLACQMGASSIIAVDLEAIGVKKKVKYKGVDIKFITSKHDLGSFLIFDRDLARKNIFYGYTDTLKEYNKLCGEVYSFKRNTLRKLNKKYYKKYIDKLNWVLNSDSKIKNKIENKIYKKELTNENILNEIIEKLGTIYEIDDTKIYRLSKYNKVLLNKIKSIDIDNVNTVKTLDKQKRIKYLAHLISKSDNFNNSLILQAAFKEDFLLATYISIIHKNKLFS